MRAALQRYDGIGIRIEDDVLITPGEPKVLSARRAADGEGDRGVDGLGDPQSKIRDPQLSGAPGRDRPLSTRLRLRVPCSSERP